MEISNRELSDEELKKLSKSLNELEKQSSYNFFIISILILLTIFSFFHIYYNNFSNWSIISKFLVCSCPIYIWVVIENKLKFKSKSLGLYKSLKNIKQSNSINIISIKANRILEFRESDDEGIFYLVENSEGICFYLYDEQYLIPEQFPCDCFDIYTDKNFVYAIDEKLVCKGSKIQLIIVSDKVKSSYFNQNGIPSDLQIENKSFDEIVDLIKKI